MAILRAMAAIAGLSVLATATAVARPGTPTDITVRECGEFYDLVPRPGFGLPALCVRFVNTATETVRFDVVLTRDGVPGRPARSRVGCLRARVPGSAADIPPECTAADNLDGKPTTSDGGDPPNHGFFIAELDFDTTYCVQLRAREAGSGRVSARWSNAVCQRTRSAPPPPTVPDVVVAFQPLRGVLTGRWTHAPFTTYAVEAGASLSKLAPEVDRLLPDAARPGPANRYTGSTIELNVPYGLAQAMQGEAYLLKVCARTFTGSACSDWASSLGGATPQSFERAAVTESGRVAGAAPAPVSDAAASGAVEAGGVAAPRKPIRAGMEDGIDRPGADYLRFVLERSDPGACQVACLDAAGACGAWTYVRPGVQGPKAICYLKRSVPTPVRNACCISGVPPSRSSPDALTERGGIAPPDRLPAKAMEKPR